MEYTAYKNRYDEVTITIDPLFKTKKELEKCDPMSAFDQFRIITAIDILNSDGPIFKPTGLRVNHYNTEARDKIKAKMKTLKDKLTSELKIPFNILVDKLFDYQSGEFDDKCMTQMTMTYIHDSDWYNINSLNPPDMFLYRFIMSLIQNQKIDCKISHTRDKYGIGYMEIKFKILDFNFKIECYGGIEGIYTHLYVSKPINFFDISDFMKELGYNRVNIPKGEYKSHYLRYSRVDSIR